MVEVSSSGSARELVFMADYYAEPIWEPGGEMMVDLDALPVSDALRASIREWATAWNELAWREMYQYDLRRGDASKPVKPVDAAEWETIDAEGRRHWRALCAELGDDYRVSWIGTDGAVHSPPD
jgi:hypothetical protein